MYADRIKISDRSCQILQELAERSGEAIETILDRAIENYRRQRFLEEANQAFAALRNDPEAWQEELEERLAWDITLGD